MVVNAQSAGFRLLRRTDASLGHDAKIDPKVAPD
jgi:hypothetical protein